jgi:hypothetical protein
LADILMHFDAALTKWVSGWEKRGWTRAGGQSIANLPLIKYVWTLLKERDALDYEVSSFVSFSQHAPLTLSPHQWKFEHVKGHAGIYGNEQADALAVRGCELTKLEERDWDADTARIVARMRLCHGGIPAQATTQAAPSSSSASMTSARSHQATSATSTATSNTNSVVRTSSGSAWSSVSGAGGPRSPTTPRRQTRTYMVAAPDKWELEYHDNLFMSVEQLNLLAARGWKHY